MKQELAAKPIRQTKNSRFFIKRERHIKWGSAFWVLHNIFISDPDNRLGKFLIRFVNLEELGILQRIKLEFQMILMRLPNKAQTELK